MLTIRIWQICFTFLELCYQIISQAKISKKMGSGKYRQRQMGLYILLASDSIDSRLGTDMMMMILVATEYRMSRVGKPRT